MLNLCPNQYSLFDINEDIKTVFNGYIKSKNRADRIQFICPKRRMKMQNGVSTCTLDCDKPCTTSVYGRTVNLTAHHHYRHHAAMPRSSSVWMNLYKIYTVCERTIAQIKNFNGQHDYRIQHTTSLMADVMLADCTQLLCFMILADTNQSSKHLIAARTQLLF